jgi:CheY-like chemotaxis protein
VLTALVVDDSAAARQRVATLLELGGWQVHQVTGTESALRLAALLDLNLVVTDIAMRGGHGAALLHRLRNEGCRARSVVVAQRPTERIRAEAAGAGAVACLAKPVDPRLFVDLMHGLAGTPVARRPVQAPAALHVDAHRVDRPRDDYTGTVPGRLAAIAASAQAGDATSVAAEAEELAEVSEQAGHPEIAWISRGIASDARRGVLSHARLMQLVALTAGAERIRRPPAGQATRR